MCFGLDDLITLVTSTTKSSFSIRKGHRKYSQYTWELLFRTPAETAIVLSISHELD